MRELSLKPYPDMARVLADGGGRLVKPLAFGALATGLLFASIDSSQAWNFAAAGLGIALLGGALTRQVGQIVGLEQELEVRARQLAVVNDVVSSVNASTNVGGALGSALDKLVYALDADAGAIWLPCVDQRGAMALIEQRGLPEPVREPELLDLIRAELARMEGPALHHRLQVPGGESRGVATCLSVSLGSGADDLGYLSVFKWSGGFTDTDASILAAVGSDIGGALRGIRLLTEARRLADRDPVTGLSNHRGGYQRLHTEIDDHARSGKPLAVLLMDLDNFKLFNDTYGHMAGDEVLKRVSGILRKCCRDSDTVARYGGDEFMVILPETTLKQAVKCAERIQSALARERFRCEDSAPLPIGFSYGIAVYPDDATEVAALVSTADASLYQSKTEGGNRITARGVNTVDSTLVYVKGFDLFRAMVTAVDNKDGYTRQHSEEVTTYSLEIAKAMELGDDVLQTIQLSGILHDVGKIGIPDGVLRKPGKLTDEEYAVMQQHPVFGALIVGALPGMEEVVQGVRHHHERWDGRGYPDRLAGDAIPLIGRIMAVADAYSAMTTTRPYRKGLTERAALQEIQRGLGTQFDPEIGEFFIRLREARAAEKPKGTRAASRRRATAEVSAAIGAE